jgi:hypothetical protein
VNSAAYRQQRQSDPQPRLPAKRWLGRLYPVGSIDGGAYRQVWVRSPDGVETLPSRGFETDSHINSVKNGQVMFVNGGYLYVGRRARHPGSLALCTARAQLLARQQLASLLRRHSLPGGVLIGGCSVQASGVACYPEFVEA